MSTRAFPIASIVAVAASLVGGAAAAMPSEPCYEDADRMSLPPVSDEGFVAACETWSQGAQLERDGFAQRAIPVLEQSLAAWDVPRTRFIIARAYINRDRPEEALVNAWSAMRYDAFGLSFEEVQGVEALEHYVLDHALVHVIVVVDDTSSVYMNGRGVFTGPGRWQGVVRPGALELQVRPALSAVWEATRTVEAGQRLFVAWPPRGTTAPVGPTVEPTIETGPRRATEVGDLMVSLVGFVVSYPGYDEFVKQAHAQSQTPRSPDGWPVEAVELSAEQSALCARARTQAARRVCELHDADRRRFADRINAIALERFRLIEELRSFTR